MEQISPLVLSILSSIGPHLRRSSIEVKSIIQRGSDIQIATVSAHLGSFDWTMTAPETGATSSFSSVTSTMTHHDETEQLLKISEIPHRFPQAVKPLFPSSLQIWGVANDDYVPFAIEEAGDGSARILIRHQQRRSMLGTVTIDLERGIVTEFITPSFAQIIEILSD